MNTIIKIQQYIINNDIENAIKLILDNESKYYDNAEYWNLRGIVCTKCMEFKSAIDCFKKAIKLNNKVADYYYNLAFSYENIKCYNEAAVYYGVLYNKNIDKDLKNELKEKYLNKGILEKIFKVSTENKKKTFIILSSCGWSKSQQRMHHIAKWLSKLGNDIYYICPSNNINNGIVNKKEILNTSLNSITNEEGINIIRPIKGITLNCEVYDNYQDLVQLLLDSILDTKKVIISYLPWQVEIISKLQGDFYHIYDCVDDHTDLESAFWGSESDISWEQQLMNVADLITTTSITLFFKRVSLEKRRNVILSRNAVNKEDFFIEENTKCPKELENIPEPRIVYTGYIYDRFDIELFKKVVLSNKDKSFVIIGEIKEGLIDKIPSNLYILDYKAHNELKKYLNHMQIGINPLKSNTDMVLCCDSIKNYEFLACGLPIISTPMPDVMIDKEGIYIAKNVEEFNKAIKKCLTLDKLDLSDFLIRNSWAEKAILICDAIDNNSVIDMNNKCIDELNKKVELAYEQMPNESIGILYALSKALVDNKEFEKYSRKIFNKNNIKFTFKMYIKALLENEKINEIKKELIKSNFVLNELKEELKENWEDNLIVKIIAYISIKEINTAMNLIDFITDKDIKYIFKNYIEVLLGNDINIKLFEEINNKKNYGLFKILEKKYYEKKKIYYLFSKNKYVNENYINLLKNNNINSIEVIIIDDNLDNCINKNIIKTINSAQDIALVIYNENYVEEIRYLANNGINSCNVIVNIKGQLQCIYINNQLMTDIRQKKYLKTISINQYDNCDANVYAMLKYMPENLKDKYDINFIDGKDIWNIENQVKVPLKSIMTISGFATFLYYPKFTYNIELWHASMALKGCGLMDVIDKKSGGGVEIWDKVDNVIVPSHMSRLLFSSCYGVPVEKYQILGEPRTDLLVNSDGRRNIEKILDISLSNKKVILNMPTFHSFKELNRIEGSNNFNGHIKIYNFDYEKFNQFLQENNFIVINKVHHVEERHTQYKNEFSNIYNIYSKDLDKLGLNLYEIVNGADILITDYSSIYGDFLFMNKPIIFTNCDIEEYRKNRGLLLEPYDYWTAGPKVQTQNNLQKELLKSLLNEQYYEQKRLEIRNIFYEFNDNNTTIRVWNYIDEILKKIKQKKKLI